MTEHYKGCLTCAWTRELPRPRSCIIHMTSTEWQKWKQHKRGKVYSGGTV